MQVIIWFQMISTRYWMAHLSFSMQ